jgi:uncharacterized protein YaiE (UPF0345 family)
MIKHNAYFEGQVQSLALEGHDKPATVGVMAKGEYEFSTGEPELMHVVAGELIVKLPGADHWQSYKDGAAFHVAGDSTFELQVPIDTAYLCVYG